MVTRENRVILASLLLVGLGTIALVLGPDYADGAFVVWLLVAGLGIAAPQLYLAVVDDELPARTRVRTAVLLACFFGSIFLATATTPQRGVLAGAMGLLFVALLGYEFAAGYRRAAG